MAISNIRIVLINTTHPGNIGAAARAMKNMCLSELVLVKPAQFPSDEATARASGADDVLAAAKVVENLDDALAGCHWVVGTTARPRTIGWPTLAPRACAEELVQSDPDRYVLLQQFKNPANPYIHETTTGPEIWEDTGGAIDVLVAGVGTGGTITGVSRFMKHTKKRDIVSVAVEPVHSPVITST